MPRHAFKFPREVVDAIRNHVERAVRSVSPKRYSQEAPYTTALAHSLEGQVYRGQHGSVEFTSTIFDDRGRNSAESIYGADLAITASISDGTTTVDKAIVTQSKLGRISNLTKRERQFLEGQIRKMHKLVPAPKVMQIAEYGPGRMPEMVSGNKVLSGESYRPISLPDYFTARVLTTFDGCTNPSVVAAVKDSSLSQLHVLAKLGGPDSTPEPTPAPHRRIYQYA